MPAAQTIVFGSLPDVTYGATSFKLEATSASGLPIAYVSLTRSVCTVTGDTVTIVGLGTCTIEASQAGDANTAPAVPVTQSFEVQAADDTTPETSTLPGLAGPIGSGSFPLPLLVGLVLAVALASVLLLLGFRARRIARGRTTRSSRSRLAQPGQSRQGPRIRGALPDSPAWTAGDESGSAEGKRSPSRAPAEDRPGLATGHGQPADPRC